jgi:hypothetical protein
MLQSPENRTPQTPLVRIVGKIPALHEDKIKDRQAVPSLMQAGTGF